MIPDWLERENYALARMVSWVVVPPVLALVWLAGAGTWWCHACVAHVRRRLAEDRR